MKYPSPAHKMYWHVCSINLQSLKSLMALCVPFLPEHSTPLIWLTWNTTSFYSWWLPRSNYDIYDIRLLKICFVQFSSDPGIKHLTQSEEVGRASRRIAACLLIRWRSPARRDPVYTRICTNALQTANGFFAHVIQGSSCLRSFMAWELPNLYK